MAAVNKKVELTGVKEFRITEAPVPTPAPGAVVVKTSFAGVCHTDVHFGNASLDDKPFTFPRVLGHEISGTVYAVGSEAKTGLKPGDRVVIWPWGQCRQCVYCRAHLATCAAAGGLQEPKAGETYGWYKDGGYQNYVTVDSPEMLVPVKDGLDMDKAALIPCSGITSYSAVLSLRESVEDALKMKGGARVAVVGAGGLALWAIQMVKAVYGAKVTVAAVDVLEEKLSDAKTAGADVVHCWSKDAPFPEAVKGLVMSTGGYFDGIIDFTGISSCLERAFYSLNQKGTLSSVGLAGRTLPSLDLFVLVSRNIKIKGNLVGSIDHCKAVMELVGSGEVKPPPITHINLEDVEGTIEKLAAGTQRGRAVVQLDSKANI